MDTCIQIIGVLALTAFVYLLLPDAVHKFCYGIRRRVRRRGGLD